MTIKRRYQNTALALGLLIAAICAVWILSKTNNVEILGFYENPIKNAVQFKDHFIELSYRIINILK